MYYLTRVIGVRFQLQNNWNLTPISQFPVGFGVTSRPAEQQQLRRHRHCNFSRRLAINARQVAE